MWRRQIPSIKRSYQLFYNVFQKEQAKLFEQERVMGMAINQMRYYSKEAPKAGSIFKSPVTYTSLGATAVIGAGMMWYYTQIKEERDKEVKKKPKEDDSIGTPMVGAPFELVDQDGKNFKSDQLLGEFAMLYFGFTHCPDICPDELEKISEAVDIIKDKTGHFVQPIMVTCDPFRDTPQQMKQYVQEFHPKMVGLTGDPDVVKEVCRSYRVYFMETDKIEDDYLVDHSIITYLVDPEGKFVTFFGKNFEADQIAKSVSRSIKKWKKNHPEYVGNVE